MPEAIYHDYHYGSEADQYTFYRLPKVLFSSSRYKSLSDGAKILYGLMLDRMALSMKNGWLDEQNRVYIFFTLEDVQEYMNCKHEKAVKMLGELDTQKGIGLIERVKQGQGRPTVIYVKKFITPDFGESEVKTSEKQKSALPNMPHSRLPKIRSQDFRKSDTSNTENNKPKNNKNNISENNPSIHPLPSLPRSRASPGLMDGMDTYREIIMENIEYDILAQRYDRERLDEAVEIMLEAVYSKREYIRVAGDEYPREVVKRRLLKLTSSHIEYAFDCINKNTSKVYNIKAYILTTLYNAPVTIDSYYRAEVAHDLYGS
ncbi:MAG: DUF6017 domain-containing protein [Oscillospiraceae bacterium]